MYDLVLYKDRIDVALFCGGSVNDAQIMVPNLHKQGINTVDSYDNHEEIKNGNYKRSIQSHAKQNATVAIIGAGWDPGYLSIQRILNKAIMPTGTHNTLYGGKNGGLSMGHTNAIKSIPNVIAAHQTTLPRPDAKTKALRGIPVPANDRHRRICHIVADPIHQDEIRKQIQNTDGYFKNQQLEINFISMDEFTEKFSDKNSHGGQIISVDDNAKINLQLDMKSNPMLTANAMLCYARANHIMQSRNISGAFTIDQIPPAFLMADSVMEI